MTTDGRRFNAIESIPYHMNARSKTKTYQEKIEETLPNGKRRDGRNFDEARKICK